MLQFRLRVDLDNPNIYMQLLAHFLDEEIVELAFLSLKTWY